MPSSWSGFSRRATLKTEPSSLTPKKVVHIITRLDQGGSARETLQTVLGHNRGRFRVSLESLPRRPSLIESCDDMNHLLRGQAGWLSLQRCSPRESAPTARHADPTCRSLRPIVSRGSSDGSVPPGARERGGGGAALPWQSLRGHCLP